MIADLPSAGTVTRFAPSPTGLLHLGHAYAAFRAAEAAKNGRFLLRIEDIDHVRCRPEFEAAIYEDLSWLGLRWETPVRRQSAHFADYKSALERLQSRDLLYPCFCTRADIAAAASAPHPGPEGLLYPGTCRHLTQAERQVRIENGMAFAVRLKSDDACAQTGALTWHDETQGEIRATPEIFGDVVLARKDTPTSYHLACTWDDALQGVTLVTRGDDLFQATHVHRLLQALLDLPTPRYAHHGLILGADGKKYSKRDKAPTLQALREAGKSPDEVREMLGHKNVPGAVFRK